MYIAQYLSIWPFLRKKSHMALLGRLLEVEKKKKKKKIIKIT